MSLDVGVLSQADSGRFDPARMRAERQYRVLAGMADDGIDALLLGTGANLRYATGARPLWLAGTRPWAPLAVVLRDGETHLLANSDDGVPPEVPLDHLFRASWNPGTVMERLAAIAGLSTAETIGVDGLSPLFEGLLSGTFPKASLADASGLLQRARATKTEDELFCLRTATAICEAGLAEVAADPVGQTERQLHGRFVERMSSFGTTIPAFDGTFCVVDDGQPLRRFVTDRVVEEDDTVVLDAGVMFNGYEGGLARTWGADTTAAQSAMDELLERCRPGATPQDLPGAYGIGLGVEPLATEVGSTLCLEVEQDGVLLRDTVLLRADGPDLLSR